MMLITPTDREKIKSCGWVKLSRPASDTDDLKIIVREVATEFGLLAKGRDGAIVERLSPKPQTLANPSSLSIKYGLTDFPFHNDTAHWLTPSRYIILACEKPGSSSAVTRLVDAERAGFTSEEREVMFSAAFFVGNGRKSFYSSVLSSSRKFIRYDPGCMTPQNDDAHRVMKILSYERLKICAEHIDWKEREIAIIDNWRVLHGRAAVMNDTADRTLLRCMAV